MKHLKLHMSELIRRDTFQKREYLVLPAIITKVGVSNDIFYSEKELKKSVSLWNGKPVIMSHATDAMGNGVQAASTKEGLEQIEVGRIFNTKLQQNKLKTEVWLNIEQVTEEYPELIERLEDGLEIDLSMGVVEDDMEEAGEFEGVEYSIVASDIVPDHLAILLDEAPACADAKMPRLHKKQNKVNDMDVTKMVVVHRDRVINHAKMDLPSGVTLNAFREKLASAIQSICKKEEYCYLIDVTNDGVIYEVCSSEPKKNITVMRKYDYDSEKDTITLGDVTPVAVKVLYEPVSVSEGSSSSSTEAPLTNHKAQAKGQNMKKDELINKIITHSDTQFGEDDRETLNGMEEVILHKLLPKEKIEVEVIEPTPAPVAPSVAPVTHSENPKPLTKEDVASIVKDVVKETYKELQTHSAKEKLVSVVAQHSKIPKEDLMNMSEAGLKVLLEEHAEDMTDVDFSGIGMPISMHSAEDDGPEAPKSVLLAGPDGQ